MGNIINSITQVGGNGLLVVVAMTAVMATVLFLAAGLNAVLAGRRNEIVDRLASGSGDDLDDRREGGAGRLFGKLARPFAWVTRPTRAADLSRLRGRMVQAGIRSEHALELFLASKLVLAVFAIVAFLQVNGRLTKPLLFPMDLMVAVWVCGAAFLLPSVWLSSRIKQRQLLISRPLPDAMDLLVTCVEAGLGLDAALARVAGEIKMAAPVLGTELQLTFLEIQAGVPRRESFRRLAERTGVEDLRQLSAVLTQTEIFGTSIAKALRVHAESMRVKRMQRAEEKAGMAGVKMMVPLIMCILPSLVAVVLGPAMVKIFQSFLSKGSP